VRRQAAHLGELHHAQGLVQVVMNVVAYPLQTGMVRRGRTGRVGHVKFYPEVGAVGDFSGNADQNINCTVCMRGDVVKRFAVGRADGQARNGDGLGLCDGCVDGGHVWAGCIHGQFQKKFERVEVPKGSMAALTNLADLRVTVPGKHGIWHDALL
jgi:hypothetical protein